MKEKTFTEIMEETENAIFDVDNTLTWEENNVVVSNDTNASIVQNSNENF